MISGQQRSELHFMKHRFHPTSRALAALIVAVVFIPAGGYGQQDPGLLQLEKEIPLIGVEGRIDHFSVDAAGKRIFIAALENGTVEVVDLDKGQRTTEIKGLKEPQGCTMTR
jgi:hypothetical protein